MEISDWLKQAEQKLHGIGTARLDALVLLEDALGIGRARLLAEPSSKIKPEKVTELEKLLKRRARHEPLAYIRGKAEFYGREFVLTPAVLQPRPESETMIELFKALPLFAKNGPDSGSSAEKTGNPVSVADIGTGSGAIGITAALEVPKVSVDLLEVDSKALQIAKINVDKFTLTINVIKSDLLDNAKLNYDVLLCNLPYVPDDYPINLAAAHEPGVAIFGGPDGLELYRRLFSQIAELSKQSLYILIEALPSQHSSLESIAGQAGYHIVKTEDFIQVFGLGQKIG